MQYKKYVAVLLAASVAAANTPVVNVMADTFTAAETDTVTITADDVDWDELSFTYDGDTGRTLTGTTVITTESGTEYVSVTAEAVLGSTDVGTHTTVLTSVQFSSASVSFSGSGPEVTITPAAVPVSIGDLSVVYGGADWESIQAGEIPYSLSVTLDVSGLSSAAAAETTTDLPISLSGKYPGTYAISLADTEIGNFVYTEKNAGTLTIVSASLDAPWAYVELSGGVNAVEKNGTVYLSQDGSATFAVKDGTKYFTDVAVTVDGETGDTVYGADKSGALTGSFYLYSDSMRTDGDMDTEGDQDYELPENAVVVDADGPELSAEITTEAVSEGVYDETPALSVTASDELSGVSRVWAEWSTEDASGTLFDYAADDASVSYDVSADVPEGAVSITVYAEDAVGNVTEGEPITFEYDAAAPVLSTSWDNTSDTGYYTSRVWTVAIDEDMLASVSFAVNGKTYTPDTIGNVNGITLAETEDGYELTFDEEGTYTGISCSVTDIAKHVTTVQEADFTIDRTAPADLAVRFLNGSAETAVTPEKEVYVNHALGVRFEASDESLQNGGSAVVTATKDGKAYAFETDVNDWTETDGLFTSNTIALADGDYTISLTVTDAAGNESSTETYRVIVDTQAPKAALYVNGEDVTDSIENNKDYGVFKNTIVNAVIEAEDETAGIASVSYKVYEPDSSFRINLPETEEVLAWDDWTAGTRISLDPDEREVQTVLYARVEDKAGNIIYLSSKEGIIAEVTAPNVSLTLPSTPYTTDDGLPLYADDFSVSLAADDSSGSVHAGLDSVSWSVSADGNETQNGTEKAKRDEAYSGTFTVDAEKSNGRLRITASTVDLAGNHGSTGVEAAVDVDAPSVSVSWDDNGVKNGRYFNSARTATVRVSDANIDDDGVIFTVNGRNYHYQQLNALSGVSAAKVSTGVYQIIFGNGSTDADYTFGVTATDYVGHATDYVPANAYDASFTIDEVAPSALTVSFRDGTSTRSVSTTSGEPTYFNGYLHTSFSTAERNLKDGGEITITETRDGEVVSRTTYEDVDAWTASGNTYFNSGYSIDSDGTYALTLTVTDAAGNTAESMTYHFVRDTVAPSMAMWVQDTDVTDSAEAARKAYAFFDNASIPVRVFASDDTSGVASLTYHVYHPSSSNDPIETPSLSTLSSWDWVSGDSLSIDPDEQAVIYARAIDRAGNETYISSKSGIIAERVVPNAVISLENTTRSTASGTALYNGNVDFSILADDSSGTVHSGLSSLTWEVVADGAVTQSGSYNLSGRSQSYTGTGTIDASRNNTNDVILRTVITDYAGNSQTIEEPLSIDTTAPRVEITFDSDDAANGKYYNHTRTATVRIYERNFSESGVDIDVNGGTISGWTTEGGSGDDTVHVCTIVFSEDGDYNLSVTATDLAGNTSETVTADEFTVDQTLPEISVTWSGEAANEIYYNDTRTATICVTEHNFRADEFSAAITAVLDGAAIPAPALSDWTTDGDTHTATISFSEDGEYSFVLNYTDLAGNEAQAVSESRFVIDKTLPVITFTDVEENASYTQEIAPVIAYSDRNVLDKGGASFTLVSAKNGEIEIANSATIGEHEGTLSLADIPHGDTDDIYTLTATVTDYADNQSVESITFKVNRDGSVFTLDEDTEALMEQYYVDGKSDLVVIEKNVDEIVDYGVTLSKDGVVTELTKNDFTVTTGTDEYGWNVNIYTIHKSAIDEEGVYEIIVHSTDASGNTADTAASDVPMRFAIDMTAPSVVITGIMDGEKYRAASVDYTVHFADETSLAEGHVLVDGVEVADLTAEELRKNGGKITLTLSDATHNQTIEAYSVDAAGNSSRHETVSVLVTLDSLTWFTHSYWFIALIAAIAAAAAGLVFFFVKRKKDEDETTDDLE